MTAVILRVRSDHWKAFVTSVYSFQTFTYLLTYLVSYLHTYSVAIVKEFGVVGVISLYILGTIE
jgi:hypothetical protein